MGHLLLVSIRPPPATYVCPAAHLIYASGHRAAHCARPPGHPPPYVHPATRLLYASAGPPAAHELARLHATAARAPGRSPHSRARPIAWDRGMSPQPVAAPTSCTSPATRLNFLDAALPPRPAGGDYLHTIEVGLGPPAGGIVATGERGSAWTIWSPTNLDHTCDGRGWPRLATARATLRQRRRCDGE